MSKVKEDCIYFARHFDRKEVAIVVKEEFCKKDHLSCCPLFCKDYYCRELWKLVQGRRRLR